MGYPRRENVEGILIWQEKFRVDNLLKFPFDQDPWYWAQHSVDIIGNSPVYKESESHVAKEQKNILEFGNPDFALPFPLPPPHPHRRNFRLRLPMKSCYFQAIWLSNCLQEKNLPLLKTQCQKIKCPSWSWQPNVMPFRHTFFLLIWQKNNFFCKKKNYVLSPNYEGILLCQ